MLLVDVAGSVSVACCCRSKRESQKTPEPEFKNPQVSTLFQKWRQVWLLAMDRRRKLQDALDRQNEVSECKVAMLNVF